VHAHIHPSRLKFTTPLAIGSVDHHIELRVSGGVTRMAITVPRAPLPRWGVTPPRVVCPQPRPALPYVQEVRRAETAVMIATSVTNQFRGCSHSVMFRLPHLLDPQVAPTAEAQSLLGSRAVYATQCPCGYPSRTVVSLRV
jgi:hypothetical protein